MAGSSKPASLPERERQPQGPGAPAKGEASTASNLVEAAKEKAQDVATGISELAGEAKDKAQEWASAASGAVGQATDKAQEWGSAPAGKVSHVSQDLIGLVRRYPLPALLVGFGLGFLAGRLTTRV